MTREQMKAMLDRGHRDVRIKVGPYASMAAKVIHPRPVIGEMYLIRLSNQREFVALPEEFEPAFPMGPDKFQQEQARRREEKAKPGPDLLREYNDPRQQEVRECLKRVGYTEGPSGTWTLKEPEPARNQESKFDPMRFGEEWLTARRLQQDQFHTILAKLRDRETSKPKPPATIFTTHMGALAWQQQKPSDRKAHYAATGHVLEVWATRISANYATRHLKFEKHLPADEVGPMIDRAFSGPPADPITVGHGYDGLDDLFANCG